MAAMGEFDRLIARAGVYPYRRVGKVRVAHHPRTPAPTVAAALEAVRSFAVSKEGFAEPTPEQFADWQADGLRQAEACDDPCPQGIDPGTTDIQWLAARCERYHFRLDRGPDGGLVFVPLDGWTMKAITQLLPSWFTDACRARRAELATLVGADPNATRPQPELHPPPPPPADVRPDSCVECRAHVWDPAGAAVLCDQTACPMRRRR